MTRRIAGWVFFGVGAMGTLVLVVLALFTPLHVLFTPLLVLATFIPWIWIPLLLLGIGLVLLTEGIWELAVAGLVIVAMIVLGWRAMPDQAGYGGSPRLTVGVINAQYGRVEVDELDELFRQVTVLVVLEYTPELDRAVKESSMRVFLRSMEGTMRDDAGGTMVLSQEPMRLLGQTEGTAFDNVLVEIDDHGVVWKLLAVHQAPPQLGSRQWDRDADAILELAKPHMHEPLIVAGDFNAIEQHHTMRKMTSAGLQNAHEYGWTPTWPVNSRIPAFARIDHVLHTDSLKSGGVSNVVLEGTDHAAVRVSVSLR